MSRTDLLGGKVALITGAASGQGRAASVLFAENGARIAVIDINDEGADETVALVHAAGSDEIKIGLDNPSVGIGGRGNSFFAWEFRTRDGAALRRAARG